MAVGIEEFSRIVSNLHTVSPRPGAWERTFAEISRCLDASACTVAANFGPDGHKIYSSNIAPDAAAAYESYYHRLDFIIDACDKSPVGLVQSGWKLVEQNKRSEFHADWQCRFGLTDGLFARLAGPRPTYFVMSAPMRDEPYASTERVRFVNALLPHLQHALNSQTFLGDQHPAVADSELALDIIRHGVVVVGPAGRVRHLNAAARRMTAAGDGLRLRSDHIEGGTASFDGQLKAMISSATVGVADHGVPRTTGGHLLCGRPSGKRPYIVRVLPLDSDGDPRAAIVLVDPEEQPTPPKALLQNIFGLTQAETEVALRILDGASPSVIAEESMLAVATVKTHLHHIFRKTGTRRQVDLAQRLSTLVHDTPTSW